MTHPATCEAAGRIGAKAFFDMLATDALGPGMAQIDSGRLHGFGPRIGHTSLLAVFARVINAQRIVELGTGLGVGTRAFMEACCYTGGHVWSVDHIERPGRADLQGDARVTFVVDTTVHFAQEWNGGVDLVYVDADHSAKSALEDLEAWVVHRPKLFLMDDTMDVNTPHGSPLEAAEVFCRTRNWSMWNLPLSTGLCVLLPNATNVVSPQ